MKEPIPEDFNISRSQLTVIEGKYNKFRTTIATICASLGFILAMAVLYKKVWNNEPLLLGLLMSIFPSAVVAGLGKVVGNEMSKSIAKKVFKSYCEYIDAKEKYNHWFIRTQQEFWSHLNGRAFEQEVAALFRKKGYKAEVTPHSNDKGVDIVLNESIPVQCKAHKNPIAPAVAREFYGTLKHFKARQGILISLNGFSPGVIEFIKGKNIELLDMSHLIYMQKELGE